MISAVLSDPHYIRATPAAYKLDAMVFSFSVSKIRIPFLAVFHSLWYLCYMSEIRKHHTIFTGNRNLMQNIRCPKFRNPNSFHQFSISCDNISGFRNSETEIFSAGNGKLMLTISVSEFRKPKIFRRERKIDANYFGFRNSETEIISLNF